ncbi:MULTISPECIES: TIGR04086 family membrane protein [Thermoactinomyces]|jgi:putative membrane protein (TIGR04086 family)|uniref:TIGR04086 family membrane protein n=1 Tax=Thermoactinomyces daqus TaxID=1329516 RepID=A0A7W2AG75_9BACL|nr:MULTISPECIES: TIGR04086 family membrane protein [Thermoactinomyces]MBA4541351.1 TIGR04086 family membrane protein [Thermoactinomyces daqus]MBH8596824.1 TIGR04086 family membrane protein [Thermoactinomyces sp. CICC 10523]MBH8603584.1 TIGR04086 family membrane protein [Thermoactinomyces sp. CICC 10522]MBH8606749.1 TIGR04086 family membrane protein [Thermoactinomyces sp. CICC 10521]
MKEAWFDSAKKGWQSPWIIGQLFIWGIIFIGSFIVAIFLRYSSLESADIPILSYILNGLALFAGGFVAGKKSGKRGLYYGAAQGIIYVAILLLIGFLAFDSLTTFHPFMFSAFAIGLSSLGGILGVNNSKSS